MVAELTIFYAADLHGSDVCFKKWLRAGEFYGADVVVIGGDLTGKILVPMYPAPGPDSDHLTATWHGRRMELRGGDEIEGFRARARAEGSYAVRTTPEEMAEVKASLERERELFNRLKAEALEQWVALANERLAGSRVRAMVMPGNDDPVALDPIMDEGGRLENVHGRAVELAAGIWMASWGESTPTPWHTPREVPEEELGERVAKAVADLPEEGVSIWNLHMPPFDTGVDAAPKIDEQLRVQYDGSSQPIMTPVGSTAIRQLIEERQPTLALHGHIHEGRGRYTLGGTVGFNPGSVYSEGSLLGVLIRVSARRGIMSYTFTTG